ncbi:hypothetical protein R80B4_02416 [Fibrobacteres bacterium R8-0-B4]
MVVPLVSERSTRVLSDDPFLAYSFAAASRMLSLTVKVAYLYRYVTVIVFDAVADRVPLNV